MRLEPPGVLSGRFVEGNAPHQGRRQIVGAATHVSDAEAFRRLNDDVCPLVGEVRTLADRVDLVVDVAELVLGARRRLSSPTKASRHLVARRGPGRLREARPVSPPGGPRRPGGRDSSVAPPWTGTRARPARCS